MSYLSTSVTDSNNLGYFATSAALIAAYPIGVPGAFALVGATDTFWVWDDGTNAWVNSGNSGTVSSVFGRQGAVTAQNGDYTTDQITEGTTLFFTFTRVRNTIMTGISFATSTAVVAADSVLIAIGKLQAQVTNRVSLTGDETIAGVKTFSSDVLVPDEVYDATTWNGSLGTPTKNALRDKIESMTAGSGITRIVSNITGNTTAPAVALTDYDYNCTGPLTLTLPTAVGNTNEYSVTRISGLTTVATTASQTINGSPTAALTINRMTLTFLSDGANWNIK